jgi:uncharacterized membrane protein YjgN (DUF898 family)
MTELAQSIPEAPPAPPAQAPARLRFTGTGGEYFRIWVVNLLLTVVTAGIYSAWAKVRKTRYFWTNTQLGGAAFQYHGNPAAILRGRILVGVLFVAYSLAGRISLRAGVAAAVVLGVLAPWFFLKAMRFKLTNTTWRGVRFGFDATPGAAYAALAPAVILWVLFAAQVLVLQAAGDGASPAPLFALYALLLALAPLLHARIKRFQHGATTWGSQRFELEPSTRAFYGVYVKAFLVALAPAVLAGAAIAVSVSLATRLNPQGSGPTTPATPSGFIVALVVGYATVLLVYLVVGAFFTARIQQVLWARTRGGPFRFSTTIRARGLMKVWLKNGLLTLVTLGLYWPFAAVAIARYRIECMSLHGAEAIEAVAAGAGGVERSAAGDGAVDLFGWDIGM